MNIKIIMMVRNFNVALPKEEMKMVLELFYWNEEINSFKNIYIKCVKSNIKYYF